MSKAILFDLDGTLLPMDTDQFVQIYIKHLAKHMEAHIDADTFVKALWQATHAMIENTDEQRRNEEVFEEAFISLTKLERDQIWPHFDHFYEHIFPTLKSYTTPHPTARKIVEEALRQGYQVAVATNPVFPQIAIEQRMEWAHIDDLPFRWVTYYENSTFTKPHAQYYQFICRRLNVDPAQSIMVGNDVQEDMAASQIGMKTFLAEDYLIDRGEPAYKIDDRGSLEELYDKLQHQQGVFKAE